jgi:hypothetical protein
MDNSDFRPMILSEDDLGLETWDETRGQYESWLEETTLVAMRSYRLVLEDGPDACDSESAAESSDHHEDLTSPLHGQPVLAEDGQPVLDRARMTAGSTLHAAHGAATSP